MSRAVTVYHYDAFAREPDRGNPAGVVLDAEGYSEAEMQAIAQKVGFNETVFIWPSQAADVRLKFYTPGHEMNLCGHATMAALYALKSRGRLGDRTSVRIETNVGVLPIDFEQSDGGWKLTMKQAAPQFKPFHGDAAALAGAIGLTEADLDSELPIVYGSTGAWTLLVPIKRLEAFARMRPDSAKFPGILREMPRASLHPFGLAAHDSGCFMHARHFSSPYSGTVEDPVTGTASGVLGGYVLTYMRPSDDETAFTVEQGQEIGRDGRVRVNARRQAGGEIDVRITGTAVYVDQFAVEVRPD